MQLEMQLSVVLVLALVAGSSGAAIENCHMERLMQCGDALSAFRKEQGESFPTTEEQVKKLCKNLEEAKACAETFQNKCMTPLQLETMGFLTEGSLTVYRDFCTEGSEIRTEYLKHSECLNEATKTDEAKGYYDYVEAALEDLSEKPPAKRLPTICCGYQWLTNKFNKMGDEKCGEDSVDSFNNVVYMAVSTLPDILCSGFDPESAQCTENLPPAGAKPKGTIRNSHIAKTFSNMYLQE